MAELIVLLLAAAVVSAIAARWKFAYRDSRSVQTYHSTLAHLEHIDGGSKGAAETHVKVLPGAQLRFPVMPTARTVAARPTVQTRPVVARPASIPLQRGAPADRQPRVSLPVDGRKLLFVDESLAAPAGPAAVTEAAGVAEAAAGFGVTGRVGAAARGAPARRRQWAAGHLLRPAIRMAAVAAAAALVAVVTTLSIQSEGSGRGAPLHAASSGKIAAGHESRTVTAEPRAATPAKPVPLVTGSTADSATYQVSSGPVDLTLVAVRRCWVELRGGPSTSPTTGVATFEGTLAPGEARSFSALPGFWMRIGNPAGLNVIVDGTAIPLPSSAVPYQVTVESAATSPA